MILSSMAFTCGDNIPITEMTRARSAITRAETVRAAKYAPKEFEGARSKLMECHDLLVKDQFADAKKSAEESGALARDAYDKSLPLLAKDTLGDAEKSIEEAEDAYAEKLATQEFVAAQADYNEAGELFQDKQFYKSYKKSLDADTKAKNARTVALGKKGLLLESIGEVQHVLDAAAEFGAKTNAADSYNQAAGHLKAANEAYGANELKKGYSDVSAAKINADEAYMISAEETAKSRLAVAGVAVEKAERTKFAGAKDDVAAAKQYYSRAKDYLGETKFRESIDSSDEAIRIAGIAVGMKEAADESVSLTGKMGGETGTVGEDGGSDEMDGARDDRYDYYRVQYRERAKDCLWRIAGSMYKNPREWRKIYNANRDKIQNPNLILPGWVLKIPKE